MPRDGERSPDLSRHKPKKHRQGRRGHSNGIEAKIAPDEIDELVRVRFLGISHYELVAAWREADAQYQAAANALREYATPPK